MRARAIPPNDAWSAARQRGGTPATGKWPPGVETQRTSVLIRLALLRRERYAVRQTRRPRGPRMLTIGGARALPIGRPIARPAHGPCRFSHRIRRGLRFEFRPWGCFSAYHVGLPQAWSLKAWCRATWSSLPYLVVNIQLLGLAIARPARFVTPVLTETLCFVLAARGCSVVPSVAP